MKEFPRKFVSIRYFETLNRILSGELHTPLIMRVKLKEAALLKAMLFFLSKTLSLCYLCIQFFGSDFFEPFIDDSADFMGLEVRISSITACFPFLLAAASSFSRSHHFAQCLLCIFQNCSLIIIFLVDCDTYLYSSFSLA